MKGSI